MAEVLGTLSDGAADLSSAVLLAEAVVYHLKFDSPIQFALGPFIFSLDTAAPQNTGRKDRYNWVSVPRVGRESAQQYTGKGDATFNLNGIIYPYYKGGLGQLEYMRLLAGIGKPLTLIDGRGVYYGTWCITDIEEKGKHFHSNGTPRKMDFSLGLKYYGRYNDVPKLPF